MRSIPVLTLALVLYLFGAGSIALAVAAGTSSPAAPQPDCRIPAATVTGDVPADSLAVPACSRSSVGPGLAERGPGFWTAGDGAEQSEREAADPQPTVLRVADTAAAPNALSCPSYPLPVVVDGQPRQATIVACRQTDGSWQIIQYTPGLPVQAYTVPAPPAAGPSPETYTAPEEYGPPEDYSSLGYFPYSDWWGAPWFFGVAPTIVVLQKFHRFHDFAHGFGHPFAHEFLRGVDHPFAHSFTHGFNPAFHGFARGAAPGFAHGFGPGFAAGHDGMGGMHR
ncbi:MAG: hypothetical protein JO007_19455 [Alphaproteobacteria bacterium]|nr:hypothetical protein [Alphaproteobacteria bacterium]